MMRREGTVRRKGKVGGGADGMRGLEESKRARFASTSDAIYDTHVYRSLHVKHIPTWPCVWSSRAERPVSTPARNQVVASCIHCIATGFAYNRKQTRDRKTLIVSNPVRRDVDPPPASNVFAEADDVSATPSSVNLRLSRPFCLGLVCLFYMPTSAAKSPPPPPSNPPPP